MRTDVTDCGQMVNIETGDLAFSVIAFKNFARGRQQG
jgi:hypothetical protein